MLSLCFVKHLVRQGEDPAFTMTWLGSPKILKLLGAIDSDDADEVTRLVDAHPTLVEEMASFYGIVDDRMPPLTYAAKAGKLDIVKLLIGKGANFKAKSSRVAKTALHFAAEEGHEEVVTYLLANGADPGEQDIDGVTSLIWAIKGAYVRQAQVIQKHMGRRGLEMANGNRVPAPVYAAIMGSRRLLQMILEHMGDLNTRDELGCTALHWAVDFHFFDQVEALLCAGADPTIVDMKGKTPRARAEETGAQDCVEAFDVSTRAVPSLTITDTE